MQCIHCNNELSGVHHTENMPDGTVKRQRSCASCPKLTTTYERRSDKAPNGYEQRLVDKFRKMSKEQRGALWAWIRVTLKYGG